MSNDFQFYPTPRWLAKFAVSNFKDPIQYLLEPSAGDASLLIGADLIRNGHSCCELAAVEIDPNNQAILRGFNVDVIGHDFLKVADASPFSHILMNPPFSYGCDHVLHAWSILNSGEIVAIINAETIRNPYSEKRKLLVKTIADNGFVVFIDDAFAAKHNAKRSADVDVAVVYLKKESLEFDFTFGCEGDSYSDVDLDETGSVATDVGLPVGFIEAYVQTFNNAVLALKNESKARFAAYKYAALLGETFLQKLAKAHAEESGNLDGYKMETLFSGGGQEIRSNFVKGYKELKQRAWSSVLRYMKIEDKLSSSNRSLLIKEFENISKLEFSASNIYSFLLGFSQSKGELDNEMVLHVFDKISKYYPDNRSFYKGWKSNGWHRLNAFKVKSKRFILPISFSYGFIGSDNVDVFRDFDRVFCYLDGKVYDKEDANFDGLGNLLERHSSNIHSLFNKRITTEYFDVRFYHGAGTVHFFPRRKDLIERLNNYVGKLRQWLPNEPEDATNEFWEQYEKSDQISSKMNVTVSPYALRYIYSGRVDDLDRYKDEVVSLSKSFDSAAKELGIDSSLGFDAREALEQQCLLPNLSAQDVA